MSFINRLANFVQKYFFNLFISFVITEYKRLFLSHNVVQKILLAQFISISSYPQHQRQYNLLILKHLFNYFYCGFYFVRTLFAGYLQYNPFFNFDFKNYGLYDPIVVSPCLYIDFFAFPYTIVSFCLAIILFSALLEYFSTFCLDKKILALHYAVIVDNEYRQWLICKLKIFLNNLFLSNFVKTPVKTFKKWVELMRFLYCKGLFSLNKNQKQLKNNYSTCSLCLNSKTFIKATFYSILLEYVGLGVYITFSK